MLNSPELYRVTKCFSIQKCLLHSAVYSNLWRFFFKRQDTRLFETSYLDNLVNTSHFGTLFSLQIDQFTNLSKFMHFSLLNLWLPTI